MFNLDVEEKVTKNYERLVEFVEQDSRSEEIKKLFEVLNDELITAPASGKTYFHNCFPGGYLDHVLRVIDNAIRLSPLYKEMGGEIDFTKQELIFSAMMHDLGKLGTEEGPYYVDSDDWQKKRNEYYTQNRNIQYFKAPERGLMMLQKHGITITEKEWLAIRLSDGMYDEGAKSYLMNYSPYAMKTSLPYIIHWADHMASQSENDMSRFSF
tara:strand:- start:1210 stop:1842 length:633 start_codon:yes stop_codon:yes gene_type:complete